MLKVIAALGFLLPAFGQDLPQVRIGVVFDGPWARYQDQRLAFHREIVDLVEGEFQVVFPEDKILEGSWDRPGVGRAMDRLLADDTVDMILAMGILAADAAVDRQLSKPVVAPFVFERTVWRIQNQAGGKHTNLCYVAIPSSGERDIKTFRQVSSFDRMTVLLNRGLYEAVAEAQEFARLWSELTGVAIKFLPMDTVDEALDKLTPQDQAVYLTPLYHVSDADFDRLAKGLMDRKIASFAMQGHEDVELGALCGLNPNYIDKLSLRTALNVQRILLGDKPEDIPYAFPMGERLKINVDTARALRIDADWGILMEAGVLAHSLVESARTLDLKQVIREGLEANLDLAAENLAVEAGLQNQAIAKSSWRPQLSFSADAVQIDDDRAGPAQAERTLGAGARLTQLIYSDEAAANVTIQGDLQRSLESERDALRLDLIRDLAVAYLNVLNAKTLERIRMDDLELSRENLEMARVRNAVGQSGASDIYRWESVLATARKDAIDAAAQRRVAEIALNRLLSRPVNEFFETTDEGLEGDLFVRSRDLVFSSTTGPWATTRALDFLVEEGLRNAPELKSLDEGISSQKRLLLSARRSNKMPTVSSFFDVDYLAASSGVGSDIMGGPDDTSWALGISLQFNPYSGGADKAGVLQTYAELQELEARRAATVERLSQGILTAGYRASASLGGIRQARIAARASEKNFELIQDSYSRGAVSIIDLLDAQNSALAARAGEATAVYGFLIDWLEVERAIAFFDITADNASIEAFSKRLNDFLAR